MTTSPQSTDAAREAARSTDGKFGSQEHARPERKLSDTMTRRRELIDQQREITAELRQMDTDQLCELIRDDHPDGLTVEFVIQRVSGSQGGPAYYGVSHAWLVAESGGRSDDDGLLVGRTSLLSHDHIKFLHFEAAEPFSSESVVHLDLKAQTWS